MPPSIPLPGLAAAPDGQPSPEVFPTRRSGASNHPTGSTFHPPDRSGARSVATRPRPPTPRRERVWIDRLDLALEGDAARVGHEPEEQLRGLDHVSRRDRQALSR